MIMNNTQISKSSSSQNKAKMLYDVAYVINLDRSQKRWEKISKALDELELPYQRFPAIDGYNVVLANKEDNIQFTGLDIKNQKVIMNKEATYIITCDPSNPQDIFTLVGKLAVLNPGEVGIWCSQRAIWKDIAQNNYQNALIFEDDFVVNPDKFTKKLNHFIMDLPSTYDVAYLDVWLTHGQIIPFSDEATNVSKFTADSVWWGLWAAVYSNDFVKKMLAINNYISTVDNFLLTLSKTKTTILNNQTLDVYVSSHNFSAINSVKLTGHGSLSEISQMGCRLGHYCNEEAKIAPQTFYDKTYVINLDRSTERWNKVSNQLDNAGIVYERFRAVDGYKIILKNIKTGKQFTGLDIKNKIARMDKSAIYQITCNPDEYFKFTFNLTAAVKPLTAGELGIWCSQYIIWNDIVANNYQNAIVFEDDISITTANFSQNLNEFFYNLPTTYDVAYPSVLHSTGSKIAVNGSNIVSKFSNDSEWYGLWSVIISNKGAKTLLLEHLYHLAVDDYILNLARGILKRPYEIEIYTSAENLIWYAEGDSEIASMGRLSAPISTNSSHAYDIAYVINLKRSPERWERVSKHLDKIGIKYKRFDAIDGYNVSIKDLLTNNTYTGLDIKNKDYVMTNGTTYELNCKPGAIGLTKILYKAGTTLITGEIGAMCSHVMLWKEIKDHGYKNSLILEDDFIAKTDNFAQKLDHFINKLPQSYDVAYLNEYMYSGGKEPIDGIEHISKFSQDSKYIGLWSAVYSAKGIEKILNTAYHFAPVDIYLNLLAHKHVIEVYTSTIEMAGHIGPSDICQMGMPDGTTCRFNN